MAKYIKGNYEANPLGVRCPFTDVPLYNEDREDLVPPRTLLFAYYGMASHFGFKARNRELSAALRALKSVEDGVMRKLRDLLPETITILEADTGWGGVNYYGFIRPARDSKQVKKSKKAASKKKPATSKKTAAKKKTATKQAPTTKKKSAARKTEATKRKSPRK